jgi:DNA modification methylase
MTWRIECADALEFMAGMDAGSVDAVITDPPYGRGTYHTDIAVLPETYAKLIAISKCSAFFGYPETLVKLCVKLQCVPSEWVTWYPLNKSNARGGLLCKVQECIAFFGVLNADARVMRERTMDAKRIFQMIKETHPERNGLDPDFAKAHDVMMDSAPGTMFNAHLRQHPNEKPVSLMCKLIELASREGDTILDPFCGSGTTGVACIQTGRNFIGCDLSPEYVAIARKRCEAAAMQGRLL